jgi:hypothetical protein
MDDFPHVTECATALLNFVRQLKLTDDEKTLLLQTVYFELRVLYLSEDIVSGYNHLKGVEPDLDALTEDLIQSIEDLYEDKDMLDLEELVSNIGALWGMSE